MPTMIPKSKTYSFMFSNLFIKFLLCMLELYLSPTWRARNHCIPKLLYDNAFMFPFCAVYSLLFLFRILFSASTDIGIPLDVLPGCVFSLLSGWLALTQLEFCFKSSFSNYARDFSNGLFEGNDNFQISSYHQYIFLYLTPGIFFSGIHP